MVYLAGKFTDMPRNFRSILTGAVLVLGASVPVLLAVEAARDPGCSRECLVQLANNYLESWKARDPAVLVASPNLTVTENGRPIRLGEGLWQAPGLVGSLQILTDEPSGEVGIFGVAGGAREFAVRLKVDHRRIREVETLAVRSAE